MSFVFKSTIGLGAVYFAMFAPALKSSDVAPTASLCAGAVQAQFAGEADLRARWSAAGCALAISAQSQRLTAPLAAASKLTAAPAPARRPAGSLTEADLREPWFGPSAHSLRKAGRRG